MDIDLDHFKTWTEYWGAVASTTDRWEDKHGNPQERVSTIYGFENFTEQHQDARYGSITETSGSVFGYVTAGSITLHDKNSETMGLTLKTGRYFSVPAPVAFELAPFSRIVAIHSSPFTALRQFGGPIEPKGRLRYIDGCSASLLITPPRLGEPCLNLLHFPPNIHQTAHTHPSVRCGAISSGRGYCIDGDKDQLDLLAGMIWVIPNNTIHSFHTYENADLNVIAYHPDSDWGPEDEEHPMLNRTWVDGTKIDNTKEQHMNPDIMKTETT